MLCVVHSKHRTACNLMSSFVGFGLTQFVFGCINCMGWTFCVCVRCQSLLDDATHTFGGDREKEREKKQTKCGAAGERAAQLLVLVSKQQQQQQQPAAATLRPLSLPGATAAVCWPLLVSHATSKEKKRCLCSLARRQKKEKCSLLFDESCSVMQTSGWPSSSSSPMLCAHQCETSKRNRILLRNTTTDWSWSQKLASIFSSCTSSCLAPSIEMKPSQKNSAWKVWSKIFVVVGGGGGGCNVLKV